jgi:hypothetical protein
MSQCGSLIYTRAYTMSVKIICVRIHWWLNLFERKKISLFTEHPIKLDRARVIEKRHREWCNLRRNNFFSLFEKIFNTAMCFMVIPHSSHIFSFFLMMIIIGIMRGGNNYRGHTFIHSRLLMLLFSREKETLKTIFIKLFLNRLSVHDFVNKQWGFFMKINSRKCFFGSKHKILIQF